MRQWFYSKWKQYNKLIFRILAFAIAILISAFFLPKSGQFKYEYEKGRPWRHANLIAPFDFPIYKSLPELKTERDSLLKHFRPYYTRDSTISDHIRQQNRHADTCKKHQFKTRLSNVLPFIGRSSG
jgi:hypothetical protein